VLPQDLIALKKSGKALSTAQVESFVAGLANAPAKGQWADAQVGAMAMAICLNGMTQRETTALTVAMSQSGQVLDWRHAKLHGPIVDKHSTGGVGDKVSLLLAPLVAACGGVVPMISGRGLGHTGGTLDKLESLPGYKVNPTRVALRRSLREVGCAIVGASANIAPADKRLYAIRDVTATVASVPLITASILSKKLAAGLDALVMDVKVGNGAFCPTLQSARTLAQSIVAVARSAGLRTHALVTDMNQPLGRTAGNALEVQEVLNFFTGHEREPRLWQVTRALAVEMLLMAGLAHDEHGAQERVDAALAGGHAAERFARMVALAGGPRDVFSRQLKLPQAPVVLTVKALTSGWIEEIDTGLLGQTVVALGGGRTKPGAAIDARVGLSALPTLGQAVERDAVLAVIHAASDDAAQQAQQTVRQAIRIGAAVIPPAVIAARVV
jgi:thymidine phosphorylase